MQTLHIQVKDVRQNDVIVDRSDGHHNALVQAIESCEPINGYGVMVRAHTGRVTHYRPSDFVTVHRY